MAIEAMLLRESGPAAGRVPRFIEETRGVEVCKQIGGLAGAQLGTADAGGVHGAPHHGSVVPHGGGEMRRRVAPADDDAEVGAHFPAAAIDPVTPNALFLLEDLLS